MADLVQGLGPSQSEGDVNQSPRRSRWQSKHLNEETRTLLARDSAAFLHQSVSTPCLTAIAKAEGMHWSACTT